MILPMINAATMPGESLLPPMAEIPADFKTFPMRGDAKRWGDLQSEWFYRGLHATPKVKPGIDAQAAIVHLAAAQGAFDVKHEHKEAGVAYLMSLWMVP